MEALEGVLHMVGGLGDTSYASNSRLQENVIFEAKETLKESLQDIFRSSQPKILFVADLGCSSGSTTFMVLSEILKTVSSICFKKSSEPPEIQYLMNDLPGNDFNTIFQNLTNFKDNFQEEKKKKSLFVPPFYVLGVPGSFYGRLFPKESVHLVHASFSVHWLSKVPPGLEDEQGTPINRENIYISKTSPPSVQKSYLDQFQKDFSKFLKLRCDEIISDGQMVLTIPGRSKLQQLGEETCYFFGLMAEALMSTVSEGLIAQQKVDEFNLPMYAPAMEEIEEIIVKEGSFDFCQSRVFKLNWDPFDHDINGDFVKDNRLSGENVAKCLRAAIEPLLASHFGEAIMDNLFSRYAEYVARHLLKEKTQHVVFVLVLKKKE